MFCQSDANHLAMVASELAALKFTHVEWCAILDANNGVEPFTGAPELSTILWANVFDSGPELGDKWYAMFKDYWKYEWVLPVYRYEGLEPLLATLAEKVIAPAEEKVKALQERRRMIEAELKKPQ